MKLAWGARVSPEFRAKVIAICDRFGWPEESPSWLMSCIAFETGETFSPSVRNAAGSGATGLIQFMPTTAKGLGTTTDDLAGMTALDQLDYVAKYFKPYASRIESLADMYMAILLPKAIGLSDTAPLFTDGKAYRQNAGLDKDNDGIITKAEATGRVQAMFWKGMQDTNCFDITDQPHQENTMPIPLAVPILMNALPTLLQKLPEIAQIFKNPDVAARNVEAVSKVGQILVDSTASANIQEAVEKIAVDPVAASAANTSLRMSRADLADMMEQINDMEQKNIAAARTMNAGEPMMIDSPWIKLKFIHLLSLVFVVFSGAFVTVHWLSLTAELKGAVITLMIIAGWNGVRDYWMGSSSGSDRKTDLLNKV